MSYSTGSSSPCWIRETSRSTVCRAGPAADRGPARTSRSASHSSTSSPPGPPTCADARMASAERSYCEPSQGPRLHSCAGHQRPRHGDGMGRCPGRRRGRRRQAPPLALRRRVNRFGLGAYADLRRTPLTGGSSPGRAARHGWGYRGRGMLPHRPTRESGPGPATPSWHHAAAAVHQTGGRPSEATGAAWETDLSDSHHGWARHSPRPSVPFGRVPRCGGIALTRRGADTNPGRRLAICRRRMAGAATRVRG